VSAAQVPPGERIFVGSFCHCYRLPFLPGQQAQYVLVSHTSGEVLAKLSWDTRSRRYVLLTKPGSVWNSTALSEAALWMRKLSRLGLDTYMRTTGHL
jgi:hypothetical protein